MFKYAYNRTKRLLILFDEKIKILIAIKKVGFLKVYFQCKENRGKVLSHAGFVISNCLHDFSRFKC